MKKKLKYIFLIALIITSVVYGFYKAKKATREKESIPGKTAVPALMMSQPIIEGNLPISLSFEKKEFKFPDSLPLLEISEAEIGESEASTIAEKLSFKEEPLLFQDINEGVKYVWASTLSSLIITPKTNTIKYTRSLPEIPKVLNKNFSQESLVQIASDFLIKNAIFSETEFKFSSIYFLKQDRTTNNLQDSDKETAEIFQINFVYQVSGFEMLSPSSSKPLIFVQVLPDGTIYNSEIVKFESITATKKEYQIKNYEELNNTLNESVLINLLNDYVSLYSFKRSDFVSAEIDEIKLVYLLDSFSSKTLQPVFLLEGKISVKGTSANRARFFLPATNNPQP